jgi:hypothetical protein
MDITVLIEPLAAGRFPAQTGPPWDLADEGGSTEEATEGLAVMIRDRLASGMQLTVLTIPGNPRQSAVPLIPADDLYRRDWVYRELQEAIAENRHLDETAES